MRKRVIILGIILLVLISTGCIDQVQTQPTTTTSTPVTTQPTVKTTVPPTTTPAPTTAPPTTTAPTTVPPSTTPPLPPPYIIINGKMNDWHDQYAPVIWDRYDQNHQDPTDIKMVFGFTYENYLYISFFTNGPARDAEGTEWVFFSPNSKGNEKFRVGITSEKARFWNLQGKYTASESNYQLISDFEVGIDDGVEFKMPTSYIEEYIEGKEKFGIQAASYKDGNIANPITDKGGIKSFYDLKEASGEGYLRVAPKGGYS